MAAKKKVWSVFERGATYEGPLTEVEAGSESRAIDVAADTYGFYGKAKKRLYAVPGALLTGKEAHATKTKSQKMLDRMIGRHVKDGWSGLVDGEITKWEPFGAGMTDVLVKDVSSGKLTWYGSEGLKPIDGKGPLPSRRTIREIREAEMKEDMKKIAEVWAKEPPPPRIRR